MRPQAKMSTINVLKGTPTITWANPADITYGTALSGIQLNATSDVPGSLVYIPAEGKVLDAGSQTLKVTFTPTDAVNYETASKEVSITVNKGTPTITWANPVTSPMERHSAVLSSMRHADVPGSLVYNPAEGKVLDARFPDPQGHLHPDRYREL